MAYKNSGELAPGAAYTLGNYELDISSAYDATRNVTSITARCGKIGAASKPFKVKLVPGEVAIKSWSVEANETTADVYATLNDRLPVRIEVTTMPQKTEYVDGELLDPTGIVLTAYYEDGTEWGHPASNITYNPHYADIDEVTRREATSSDVSTNWTQPIPLYSRAERNYDHNGTHYQCIWEGQTILIREFTSRGTQITFLSDSPGIIGTYTENGVVTNVYSSDEYTYNGKTVYYGYSNNGTIWSGYSMGNVEVTPWVISRALPNQNTLWVAIYGSITGEGQKIDVSWERPQDGKELTTEFYIQVTRESEEV